MKYVAMLPTITGRKVNLLDFKSEDVNGYDIAWGLSNNIRFGGQTEVPWDVLSHTGLTYMLYVHETRGQTDVATTLALLLHDAAEAYIGDMIGKLKKSPVGAQFEILEEQISRVIYARFGLDFAQVNWELIDRYDKQACHVELFHLHPALAKDTDFQQEVYHMDRYPNLLKAKVPDYIELLKSCAINHGTIDVAQLFDMPEERRDLLQPRQDVTTVEGGSEVTSTKAVPDNDIASMRVE